MKAVIICEASQKITIAARSLGIECYSCDIIPCYGGHPEWHIQEDGLKIIQQGWDFIGLHCPCTYTAISGNRWYHNSPLRNEGIQLTLCMYNLARSCSTKGYLEQPRSVIQKIIGKRHQKIQPWQYGHGECKETWLWKWGLPMLEPTNEVTGRETKIHMMPPGPLRQQKRSETYDGIAKAIAQQWINQNN